MFDRWTIRHKAAAMLAQLESAIWAADESAQAMLLDELRSVVAASDATTLVAAKHDAQTVAAEAYAVHDGVATIRVAGPIFRETPFVAKLLGIETASTSGISAALDAANADARVQSIKLAVDSPGGTVDGVPELAAKIRGNTKPVHAHVDGQASSAAYWLASQAQTLSASAGSNIGSIGVYQVLPDTSAAAKSRGATVHVIRSGSHKGVRVPGAEISDEQLHNVQREINDYADAFAADVAVGRKKTQTDVQLIATGASWIAHKAKDLGLIDQVSDGRMVQPPSKQAGPEASAEKDKMEAEKLAEIVASAEAKLAALAAKEAELDARLAEAKANAEKLEAQQKAAIVEAGVASGRIVPAQRPAIEKLAATSSADELRAFVDALPTQTRASNVGQVSAQSEDNRNRDDEDRMMRAFGLSREAWSNAEKYNAVDSGGKFVVFDGAKTVAEEEEN